MPWVQIQTTGPGGGSHSTSVSVGSGGRKRLLRIQRGGIEIIKRNHGGPPRDESDLPRTDRLFFDGQDMHGIEEDLDVLLTYDGIPANTERMPGNILDRHGGPGQHCYLPLDALKDF